MVWLSVVIAIIVAIVLLWLIGRAFLRACETACQADWGGFWRNRIAGGISLFCRYVHHFRDQCIPLPETGCALVAANHISGLDPLLLIAASPRPLRFLIAREEYERFGLNWLFRLGNCIPVDREKRPERALREALQALAAGEVVVVFPHGRIHLDSDPPRRLKGGVVRLAQRTGCPIYPVRVDDVRAAGYTFWGAIIPGYARLKTLPPLHCRGLGHDECLAKLAALLEVSVPGGPLISDH
jgi:1-acyl-sn-glycerol-3-phosphate acyltransferase